MDVRAVPGDPSVKNVKVFEEGRQETLVAGLWHRIWDAQEEQSHGVCHVFFSTQGVNLWQELQAHQFSRVSCLASYWVFITCLIPTLPSELVRNTSIPGSSFHTPNIKPKVLYKHLNMSYKSR